MIASDDVGDSAEPPSSCISVWPLAVVFAVGVVVVVVVTGNDVAVVDFIVRVVDVGVIVVVVVEVVVVVVVTSRHEIVSGASITPLALTSAKPT